jgi:hypothetical protein
MRTRRSLPLAHRAVAGATLLLAVAAGAPRAAANPHDPDHSAHPARIAAYALHPVGVILDFLIVRPAHWLVEREPFRTLFGHDD